MIKTQSASNIFSTHSEAPLGMGITEAEKEKLWEYFPHGVIAIDLETTGLSPLVDRIIEVAAYKITPAGTSVFQTLINPELPIPPHTTAIHNITDEMVVGAPALNKVLSELKVFAENLPIIAHNAKFDLGFVVMGMQRLNIKLASNEIYCSCKLARFTHNESPNHKLVTLVQELNIPLINHHRALDDAYASLKIFLNSLLRVNSAPTLTHHGRLFSLDQFEKLKSAELPAHLSQLEKLVQEAAVIEIMYSGGNYKNIFRPVKLISLLNTPEGNILYARCLLSELNKSFKLNKIVNLRSPSAEDIKKWLKK